MPTRKDKSENTEKLIIRWTKSLKNRCDNARKAGAHVSDAEATFIRFLIELGIAKYEKAILPLEKSLDEPILTDTTDIRQKEESTQKTSLFQFNEKRFLELLPYFPEDIQKRIADEELNWEQVQKQFNIGLLGYIQKAEASKKEARARKRA
jgi:hypothetical protein